MPTTASARKRKRKDREFMPNASSPANILQELRFRPEAVIAKTKLANEKIAEREHERFGRARASFENEDYESKRCVLARRIDEELRKNLHWRKRFRSRPRTPAQIPTVKNLTLGEVSTACVSSIAFDLAAPALSYRAARDWGEEKKKRRGRRSHFDSPAMKELLCACSLVYASYVGKHGKPGDSKYQGDFQALVRAVLQALDHPASEAKRSLTEAILRIYIQRFGISAGFLLKNGCPISHRNAR